MKLVMFHDDGHGWLQVKKENLPSDMVISPYSYKRGLDVYLEEDVDALVFMMAHGGVDLQHVYQAGSSPIRNYESFSQNWNL